MDARARPAAGPDDVLAGFDVRHEAYGRKLPVVQYRAQRLADRREHRAVPWVLDRGDGRIASTLLVHHLDLALDGRVFPAYGLGSVGTRPDDRRRGYGATLCRAACEANEREGRTVGLLYSAIPPVYYERMGFRTCPASGWKCTQVRELAESGEAADLSPIDPRREIDRLSTAYEAFHRGVLHPHRDSGRFLQSVEDCVDDWFFAVNRGAGGYVRLGAEVAVSLDVVEMIVPAADAASLLRGAARVALETGRAALQGWFEPPPEVREWFTDIGRARDLPMLRGAPPHLTTRFWGSDHF